MGAMYPRDLRKEKVASKKTGLLRTGLELDVLDVLHQFRHRRTPGTPYRHDQHDAAQETTHVTRQMDPQVGEECDMTI